MIIIMMVAVQKPCLYNNGPGVVHSNTEKGGGRLLSLRIPCGARYSIGHVLACIYCMLTCCVVQLLMRERDELCLRLMTFYSPFNLHPLTCSQKLSHIPSIPSSVSASVKYFVGFPTHFRSDRSAWVKFTFPNGNVHGVMLHF